MSENQVKFNTIRLGDKLSFQADPGIDNYVLGGWSGQKSPYHWTDDLVCGSCAQ